MDQIKKAQKRDLCRGETHLPQAAPWAIATPAAVWAANTSRGRAENLTGSSENPHPRRGRGVAAATCLRGKPPRNIQVAAAASPPPVNGITRRYSAAFRRSLGVSGKVSVAMMPAVSPVWCFKIHSSLYVALRGRFSAQLMIPSQVIAFNLAGEASVLRSLRTDAEGGAAPAEAGKALSFPKRAANVFCEHTLLSFGVIIAPLYGGILYSELTKPRYEGWRLSHALIHTRVFGQAAAVGSLVLVFGLKDALRRNGAPFEA